MCPFEKMPLLYFDCFKTAHFGSEIFYSTTIFQKYHFDFSVVPFILHLKHSNGAFKAFQWLQKLKKARQSELSNAFKDKLTQLGKKIILKKHYLKTDHLQMEKYFTFSRKTMIDLKFTFNMCVSNLCTQKKNIRQLSRLQTRYHLRTHAIIYMFF